VLCDIDEDALDGARAAAGRLGVADRATFARADAFDRAALAALDPKPDVVLELGLYGIYHDDARIERHFADLAELVAPEQIVFNVQTRNPEIEYIARVWINAAGERCVWRLRPVEQILGYALAAGYTPATITADRFGIYRVVRLVRAEAPA
jgi:putative methyltransferase